MKSTDTIALSIGCPAGVGPEVAVLGAAAGSARCLLVGDEAVIRRAAEQRGVAQSRLCVVSAGARIPRGKIGIWEGATPMACLPRHGKPSRRAGAAQLAWIDEATTLVRDGHAGALVTAPVSKHVIATSGASGARAFLGHTEWLATLFAAREVVMAFVGERLITGLVTTHLPLARVPRAVTKERVATTCYWLARLVTALDRDGALVVAALNPHAGEGGLLGDEELRAITPGIARAKQRLRRARIDVALVGPIGAETAIRRAAAGDFAGVVTMYHDQATIPCKLLGFGEAVNVTLGLPIVRTSVDHGTGYDIAGSGRASPRGMLEAIALAARLTKA
jgi:4-hydroxythreonine-4-phosphate dehydrogenase